MANLQLQKSSFGAVAAPRGLRIVILLCKGADVKLVYQPLARRSPASREDKAALTLDPVGGEAGISVTLALFLHQP